MKKELKSFSYTFLLSFFSKNDMLSTLLLSEEFSGKNSGEPSGGFISLFYGRGLHPAYTTL